MVVAEWRGARKYYRANRESPVCPDLANLMRKTVGLAEPLRATLHALADQIVLAFVYEPIGPSMSNGPRDIELLLVGSEAASETVAQAMECVSRQLGCRLNFWILELAALAKRELAHNWMLGTVLSRPRVWVRGDEPLLARTITSGP
jgi:hypothetical protein